MKIAIFTDSFLPGIGGTENAIFRLAVALSKKHEVMICAPSYGDEKFDETLPIKVARTKSLKVSKNDRWAFPDISPEFKKAVEDFAPDILHCHTVGTTCGFANRYGKKHGVPVVYTVHTKFRYCYMHVLKSKLLTEILIKHCFRRVNKADGVTSVSNAMIDELKSYGVKLKVNVVRNGADVCRKENGEFEEIKRIPHDKFTMLSVGLVIGYKNIGFTLDALKKVKEKRDDFIFYVVGRGPHEKRFKKQAERLGLNGNVVFTGAICDKEKLAEMYLKSDLLLFPSIADSDGLVKSEAAARGVPLLGIKNTGVAERIEDGVSGFVSENSVDDYAKRILDIMDGGYDLVKIGFKERDLFPSWDESAEDYVKVYNRLIEEKKGK